MTINYSDYKAPLNRVSFDAANGVSVCDSDIEVIDFDVFLEEYFKSINPSSKKPESVDAYCLMNGEKCLIEFKNGQFKRKDIVDKIGHSVLTLLSKENLSLNTFKEHANFILVYNKKEIYGKNGKIQNSPSKYDIRDVLLKKAKLPSFVPFGLDKTFKDIYFKNVIAYDKNEFNSLISKIEIKCPN